jgi:hypothetical protein
MRLAHRFALAVTVAVVCLGHAAPARAQVFELLSSFRSCTPDGCPPDGDPGVPVGPLVLAGDGFLYGLLLPDRREGAPPSRGAIYRIDTAGRRAIVHRFTGVGMGGCLGTVVRQALTVGHDGAVYGLATSCAPSSTSGNSIFRIVGSSFQIVQEFPSDGLNGFVPYSLFAGPGGAFYGIGYHPAVDTRLFVYEWNGALRPLARHTGPDFWLPSFVKGPDGNLYYPLVAEFGWSLVTGRVLRISRGGVIDTLYNSPTEDQAPTNDLVVGSDGHLYGTAGSPILGTNPVFRLTLGGEFTTLRSEAARVLAAGANGSVFTTNFLFPHGEIVELSPSGASAPVHTFDGSDGSGDMPPLTRGPDGHFYGVRTEGGAHGFGTFYRIRMPTVDVKANGSDGPTTVGPGDSLDISIALNAAPTTTLETSEVYVAVVTPTLNVFWMTAAGFSATPTPIYTGGLVPFGHLSIFSIPDAGVLGAGDYYWVTIIDTDNNGVPNGTFVDFVKTTRGG